MKIKYLFFAMAMTVATGASAQFVNSGGSKGYSNVSGTELDQKVHFMADLRVGSVASKGGFGVNLGATKEIASFAGCTLAWDLVNIEFAAPFKSPEDLDYISGKTGLRLFSPSFANDNLRLYTNLAIGYTCVLQKSLWNHERESLHGFGLAFGVGVQIKKKLHVGYTLQYNTAKVDINREAETPKTNHLATIGWTF
ncbi:MAG: hypothetical protein J6I86_02030 [Bacteroidaceae bacterium]|nr:hypothetical protein [Bacteroidaceae bacterium]